MKNKFNKILLIISCVVVVLIVVLAILGSFSRKGYLSEFKLLSSKNGNYTYSFRIRYYNKIFRNSDIYGVYIDTNKIIQDNSFVKEIKMQENGSPFGNLVSSKKINKINNVYYKLKVKIKFIIIFALLIFSLSILYYRYNKQINSFIFSNKKIIEYICISIISIFIIVLFILLILGNKERIGYLNKFSLNSNATLKANNIEDIKENFTVNGKLNNKELQKYILTNESITNYAYNFTVGFNDKFFQYGKYYLVYINTDEVVKNNSFIKEINMKNDLGVNTGTLISSKIIKEKKIENVTYTLTLKEQYVLLIGFLIFLLILYFITKSKNDKLFIAFIILTGFLLFLFQFWVGFPGSTGNADCHQILLSAVTNNFINWHPVFIQVMLNVLFKIFGYEWYYLFLITLICFYSGLIFIILGLYLKYKNTRVIFLYLIAFIGNIYLFNFTQLKDIIAISYLWLACSLIFFSIFVKLGKKQKIILYVFVGLNLLLSMLSRHNFIVTIYPIFVYFSYLMLKDKYSNLKELLIKFCALMFLFAILLISIYKITPMIFVNKNTKFLKGISATSNTFALQIVGCAVLSNDDSMIPKEWYNENKNFNDLIKHYEKYPFSSTKIYAPWRTDSIFNANKELSDVKKVWVKYILKHPLSYIKHILVFTKIQWTLKIHRPILHYTDEDPYKVFKEISVAHYEDPSLYDSIFCFNLERYKKEDFQTQRRYFYFFKNHLINMSYIYSIIISTLLFFVSGILWIKNANFRNKLLLITFSLAFSGFATSIIVAMFNPTRNDRYIHPVLQIAILSIISFLSFVYDRGGFKMFIKELRGKDK